MRLSCHVHSRGAALVVLTVLINLIPPVIAYASVNPVVTLVAPSMGASLTPDAGFSVTFRIIGGWASKVTDCALGQGFGNLDHPLVAFAIGELDANGLGMVWEDQNFGGPGRTTENLASHIVPNGIECTYKTFDPKSPGSWQGSSYSGISGVLEAQKWLGIPDNSTNVGDIKQIEIAWALDDMTGGSIVPQKAFFSAGKPSAPHITISGLTRGETVDFYKKYSVDVTMGKALTPTDISGEGDCEKFSQIAATATEVSYSAKCILWVEGQSNSLSVVGKVTTTDGQTFASEPTVVNVGKNSTPILRLSVTAGYGSHAKPGAGTTLEVTVVGSFTDDSLALPVAISGQKFKICLSAECAEFVTDSSGAFYYSKEVKAIHVTYALTSVYDGLLITKANLREQANGTQNMRDDFSPITGVFNYPQLPFPEKPLVSKIKITQVFAPAKVAWGKSFPVTVTSSGKGGANCEIDFQPTLNPLDKRGHYSLRIVAGKTAKIMIKPWFDQLASWPLMMACAPDGWPSLSPGSKRLVYDLGTVVLTN